jgi:muramidase (phage lysozyme)
MYSFYSNLFDKLNLHPHNLSWEQNFLSQTLHTSNGLCGTAAGRYNCESDWSKEMMRRAFVTFACIILGKATFEPAALSQAPTLLVPLQIDFRANADRMC